MRTSGPRSESCSSCSATTRRRRRGCEPSCNSCCSTTSPASRTPSRTTESAASSSVVGVRTLLARPRTREVVPADRPVAVDDGPRDLEDHALQRRSADDLDPGRVSGGPLRRVLVVDLGPGEIEEPLADEAGEDAQNQAERLVDELHGSRPYPFGRPGQSTVAYLRPQSVKMGITSTDNRSKEALAWTASTQTIS